METKGKWSIQQVEITGDKYQLENEHPVQGAGFEGSPPGSYEILYNSDKQVVVMSDNLMEIEDQEEFLGVAEGHIVIGGLGLGLIALRLLKKKGIKSITIIEIDQDVIDLVSPRLTPYPEVSVVQGDVRNFNYNVLKFPPDYVYMDIWDDATSGSFKDRISVLNHWRQCCKHCFAWALERSEGKEVI